MTLYGNASDYDDSTGGVNNSGVLKLTEAIGSQQGTAIIDDFDAGATVAGFDATFQLYIGSGNGADGMSFAFGDFADAAWGEEGPGAINGLTVSFDVFNNGGTVAEAPAIDLKWNNVVFAHRLVAAASTATGAQPIGTATTIRTQTTAGGAPVYVPVKIHVDTDGTLDLAFNNVIIWTNFPIFRPITNPTLGPAVRFGFGARTGGSTDNHWIDNLNITTVPADANSGQPFLKSISQVPVGANGSAVAGIQLEFQDGPASINTNGLKMTLNNTAVTPTITRDADVTRISYRGANGLLPTGVNTVVLSYGTTSTPAGTNSFTFSFAVNPFVTLPAVYAIPSVDKTKPGFKVRVHQYDGNFFIRGPGDRNLIVKAERELANGYIDPATGLPYSDVADHTGQDADGYFIVPSVINWNYQAPAGIGNFQESSTPSRPDEPVPGLPGVSGSTDNYVAEILTYIELKAGGYRFGFNSDDGFRASFGPGFDVAGTTVVGSFNGGRGSADTLFDVVVGQDGIYPFRISYWQGTGGANAELFYVDPNTGQKILINDPDNLNAPRAYRESGTSRPSVSRVLPVQDWIGASPDDPIVIEITDGGIPVDLSQFTMKINGVTQDVFPLKSGKVTTIRRNSSVTNLLPPGNNNVSFVYGFVENGQSVTITNNYTFYVAPYYGVLNPATKVPQSSVSGSGFSARVAQMDKTRDANQGNGGRIAPGSDANRMPAPEIQINDGEISLATGAPFPNLAAKSSSGDFNYVFDVFNFNNNTAAGSGGAAVDSGLFTATAPAAPLPGARADEATPGLPGSGTSNLGLDNYVMEATTYLDLKKGVYVFGMSSDDGFVITSAANPKDTLGSIIGFADYGRGNSGNNLAVGTIPAGQTYPLISPGTNSGTYNFSVIVPEDGIYPFRILYWEGGGGVNSEFYTLNKNNGEVLLVNDVGADPSAVPAYASSSAVAGKPWVKPSVSPTPWDNIVQQAGPGPITMLSRTTNSLASADIYNWSATNKPWADVRIGGIVANGVGDATLGLLLDGVRVPATMTTNGTDVTVSYKPNPPLASGSKHTAALVYAGTTNAWPFTVQTYVDIPGTNSVPTASADTNAVGFKVKVVQSATARGGANSGNNVPAAETQLAGTPANIALPGPNPDSTYTVPGIINWNSNMNLGGNNAGVGNFQQNIYGAAWPFPSYKDDPIPGVPGTNQTGLLNIAAEIFAYLKFDAPGYYRFGVNGDDGWKVQVGTPGVTNGTVLYATADRGAGSADIPFSFTVPQAGLYPIRLVWYQGGGGGNVEFFSYDDNGNKIPVNDPNNPNSIKAFYALGGSTNVDQPVITVSRASNGNINITWTNGGTLQASPEVAGAGANWTDVNSTGSYSTAPSAQRQFFRVRK